MKLFHRADALLGRLYNLIGTLVGISIATFAIAIALELFLRLAKLPSLSGSQELIEYFQFAGVFLAAPWVLRLGAHVRVDLVLSSVPTNFARNLNRFLDCLGLVICLTLLWFAAFNMKDAYSSNSLQMKYFNVPEWWLLVVLVISFFLLAFEFLSRIVRGGNAPEASEVDGELKTF